MAGTEDIDPRSNSRLLELESAFVGAMDAADTYVNSYEELHGRLKAVSCQACTEQIVEYNELLKRLGMHLTGIF